MEEDYWHKKWKAHDIKFNQEAPNPNLTEFFPALELSNHARVFVPLCGKSIDMLWLLQQGYEVIGIELSPIAITEFFNENNIEYKETQQGPFTVYQAQHITLFCGDYFKLTAEMLGNVSGVYDRGALIALPEATRKQYVDHYKKILKPNCQILLVTLDYDYPEIIGPPFDLKPAEIQTLFSSHFDIQVLKKQNLDVLPSKLEDIGVKEVWSYVYHLACH